MQRSRGEQDYKCIPWNEGKRGTSRDCIYRSWARNPNYSSCIHYYSVYHSALLPCFDFHEIKIINIGECLICQIFNNLRFEFSVKTLNVLPKVVYSSNFFKSSYHIFSNVYNLPLLRAPPFLNFTLYILQKA